MVPPRPSACGALAECHSRYMPTTEPSALMYGLGFVSLSASSGAKMWAGALQGPLAEALQLKRMGWGGVGWGGTGWGGAWWGGVGRGGVRRGRDGGGGTPRPVGSGASAEAGAVGRRFHLKWVGPLVRAGCLHSVGPVDPFTQWQAGLRGMHLGWDGMGPDGL